MALHSRRSLLALVGTAAVTGVASADEAGTSAPSTTATNETAQTGTAAPSTTAPSDPPAPVGDVRMVGVTPDRTAFDTDARGPGGPVQRQWCVGAGAGNRLAPLAVVDGTVFSGSTSEGLRALDARTGERTWRATVERYPTAPTVAGDRVFTTDGAAVYALGRASGRELWSRRFGDRVTTSALVASADGEDAVFAGALTRDDSGGTESAHVYALDVADGSTLWKGETEGGPVFGELAARDGVVYGGGSSHHFYAFDAATGDRRWRADVGDHATSPAVGPESVFVGDEPGVVHALDSADGSRRWTHEIGSKIRTSPAVADGTVYVAATDGNLYALDARTGDRRWRFDGGRRLTVAPTVVGGGGDGSRTVFVGSEQGNVFAVDAGTGEPRWSFQLAEGVETPPTAVDGFVFVGDREGRVYALVDESASVPADAAQCDAGRTPTPEAETNDADNDGMPDERDYAPRDASVQHSSDLESDGGDDGGKGFLPGVAVGSATTAVGVATGWWLKGRSGGD